VSARSTVAGVVASYNQESFVLDAVMSLLDQVDELVFVDDCSSDNTGALLRSFSHPKLTVIHNAHHLGVSGSFNAGVEATSSDIVLIQGGDDLSFPTRADRQRTILENPDVVLAASGPQVINESGAELPEWAAPEFFHLDPETDYLRRLFFVGNVICAPSVAVRRSDYLAHGGFHPGLDYLQDYHLWLKLASRGRFVVEQNPVVAYRKHSSNLSRADLGIDSPRRRRQRAELGFILEDFLAHAGPDVLQRLAPSRHLPATPFQELDRAEQIAILQLDHSDRVLVQRGVYFVLDALGSDEGLVTLERMGLSAADLTNLAVRADYDNAHDVAWALAVRVSMVSTADVNRDGGPA